MRSLRLVRFAVIVFAFLSLFGGYAMHQFSLFSGDLDRWSQQVAEPNILLGWILLVAAVVLGITPSDEETGR
jgi:hypothetical protein